MIAILVTSGPEYRVAHIQNPDFFFDANLDDPLDQAIAVCCFHDSECFTDKEAATKYSIKLEDNMSYVEYGIGFLTYEEYNYNEFMSFEFASRLVERESKPTGGDFGGGGYF